MSQLMTRDKYAWAEGTPLYYVDLEDNTVRKRYTGAHYDGFAKRSNALRWLVMKLQGDIQDITAKCSFLNDEIRYAEREESGR
jgi:hypothetical protein